MLIGLSPTGTRDHVMSRDPAKEDESLEPTVFEIGTLDVFIQAYIDDKMTEYDAAELQQGGGKVMIKVPYHAAIIHRVRFGLRGWRDFQDKDGNDITFKTTKRNVSGRSYEVMSDQSLLFLTKEDLQELSAEIASSNTMTEEEEKNSGGS